MSALIIDGYNVIGVLHGDREAERRKFIEALMRYRKRTGHDITVVFDGWREGTPTGSSAVTGGIRVVYSPLAENADAVIKRTIAGSRKQWIVVSSDRDIQAHAWSHGSVPIESEDFLQKLETPGTPREYPTEEDEEEYREPRRKGTARKRSRKELAVTRALRKL